MSGLKLKVDILKRVGGRPCLVLCRYDHAGIAIKFSRSVIIKIVLIKIQIYLIWPKYWLVDDFVTCRIHAIHVSRGFL